MQLATIGYEGSALAEFIETVASAGVKRVIDVRQLAQSRRPGFSKNAFCSALSEAGIDYHHIRQLGDPKPGREAARAGQMDLFVRIFTAHIEAPTSQEALKEAVSLALSKKSALVCFERDACHCHRTIVAERMAALASFRILNLRVQSTELRGLLKGAKPANRFGAAR